MAEKSNRRVRRAVALSQPRGADTRARLLDAAERLFAERGFSGVSLREIVAGAAVNVAAAHYHFGSKERLFEEVFARAAEPVKKRTMDMLQEAEQWSDRPEFLEQIVRALIVPNFKAVSGRLSTTNYGKLRAHLFLEDSAFAHKLFRRFYADVSEDSLRALRRAMPDLRPKEIAWRFHVLLASLVFTTTPAGRAHPFARGTYKPEEPDEAIGYLVPLLVSVFRARAIRGDMSGRIQSPARLPKERGQSSRAHKTDRVARKPVVGHG